MIYRQPSLDDIERAQAYVRQCCCEEDGRAYFDQVEERQTRWRFTSLLGFTGHLYWGWTEGWKASCVIGQQTESRLLMIHSTNELLATLNKALIEEAVA